MFVRRSPESCYAMVSADIKSGLLDRNEVYQVRSLYEEKGVIEKTDVAVSNSGYRSHRKLYDSFVTSYITPTMVRSAGRNCLSFLCSATETRNESLHVCKSGSRLWRSIGAYVLVANA